MATPPTVQELALDPALTGQTQGSMVPDRCDRPPMLLQELGHAGTRNSPGGTVPLDLARIPADAQPPPWPPLLSDRNDRRPAESMRIGHETMSMPTFR